MSTKLRPLAEIATLNFEIMRNAVSEATRVPARALRRRRSAHVSHSCFAGLQRRLPSGSQLPGEMQVLPFCSSHWSHKWPQNYFPLFTQDPCQHPQVVRDARWFSGGDGSVAYRPHQPPRATFHPSPSVSAFSIKP